MKRRILSLLLVMAMSAALLVGCGGSDKDTNKGNDSNVNQDADQDSDLDEENESADQGATFEGEEVSYTSKEKNIRVVYDEDIVEVKKAEDGHALRLGLVDKYYSTDWEVLKHTPQSFYEQRKSMIEAKAATPKETEVNYTPEDKDGTGNVETSVFKMTETYTNVSVSEPEKITVASGMDVYRIEVKYTMTTTYEKVSGSAEDMQDSVFESDKYYYFIDLGDGYISSASSFQVAENTLDKEPIVDAFEKMLNAIYIEIVE